MTLPPIARTVTRLLALAVVAAATGATHAPASAAPVRTTFAQPSPVYVGDRNAGASSAAAVVIPADGEGESLESTATFDRPGVVLDVNVAITGLTHASPYDLQLLLVGPGGEQALLMSDPPPSSEGVDNISFAFDDDGVIFNEHFPLVEGERYQPEPDLGAELPHPAPLPAFPGDLSVFDGTDAAGEWLLYVHDSRGVGGQITGWGLELQLATTPYPSTLSVSGVAGPITDLDVSLLDIASMFAPDMDVLLVGPQGQRATLMSDVGSGDDISGVDLEFDDSATKALPDDTALASGRFQPTDGRGSPADSYPGLTPTPVGEARLGVFNGTDPNGVWSLYAVDDLGGDFSEILGGWSLDIAVDDGVVPSPPVAIVPPPAVSQDTTSPTAKKLTPRRNAVRVSATAKVTVVASEKLAPSSVTRRTVLLAKGKTRVKAKVALERGKTIVLTPRKRLAAGTYEVTVSPKVTDLAGNAFDGKAKTGVQTLRWRFTV